MLLVVALQNVVAYSVNMADNIMLGSYSQEALSGAATVNISFYISIVSLVVLVIQSDQIFKGLPVFIHFRKYTWIKKLTREDEERGRNNPLRSSGRSRKVCRFPVFIPLEYF